MKKLVALLASCGLFLGAGTIAIADSHEGDDNDSGAVPVEIYACTYHDGKGPDDLNKATDAFNKWADKNDIDNYTAMTLVPFYSGPEQEFDVLWLGVTSDAKSLGRIQDKWLATGTKEAAGFAEVADCGNHSNFAAVNFKEPPTRDDPSSLVISFSDCDIKGDNGFDEIAAALSEWGAYRAEHGSTAGHWAFFPAYGGGGEEFDFKFIAAWQNFEDQGADWDQYSEGGYKKAGELFRGKMSCDSSRVYVSQLRRAADDGDE